MEFTKKDEEKLRKAFKDYSEEELKNFVARAIGERALLILSMGKKGEEGLDELRQGMIDTIGRLQDSAIEELKRKKLKEVVD